MSTYPYFNSEHELFRQSVRDFVNKNINPFVADWEKEQRIPASFWQQLGSMGYLGLMYDEELGGTKSDFFYSLILHEELCRCGYSGVPAAVSVHAYMATAHLAKYGSPFLKEKYLKSAIKGEMVSALAVTEPGAGSDVASIQTTAIKNGDHYLVSGSKTFISNAVYGDFITLAVKTNPKAGTSGISLLVVDRHSEGLRATKLQKMGWHASDTGELGFDNVKVPIENLIGEENQGFYYIMEAFQLERLVAAIMGIAGCEIVLETTLEYMKQREAFGKSISKFQALRHTIAQLATEIEAAKAFAYHASWLYEQGIPAVKECSMVKMLCTELAKKVADQCLQMFGGYGFMEDYPIARMYRDARVGTIVGGTSEIMKEIIAKLVIDGISYERKSKELKTDKVENTKNPETAHEIIWSLKERFKADKAEGLELTIHLQLAGQNGGDFTVKIANTECTVSAGLIGDADCTVKTEAATYAELELGKRSPEMALMTGKVKVSNIGVLMKFTGLFNRLF
jgi:acyl-CoA dehydrogenase